MCIRDSSGPYCAMNLADYGARVIKVERVDGGDQSRFWNPYEMCIRDRLYRNSRRFLFEFLQ